MQTVGVNAAEASDTVKFPRFTFGCVPRWQERKEGMIEDKKEGWSAGRRRHLDQVEKRKEKGKKSETGVKNNSSCLGAGPQTGAWSGVKVGGATEHNGGMKLSLQHNKDQKSDRI